MEKLSVPAAIVPIAVLGAVAAASLVIDVPPVAHAALTGGLASAVVHLLTERRSARARRPAADGSGHRGERSGVVPSATSGAQAAATPPPIWSERPGVPRRSPPPARIERPDAPMQSSPPARSTGAPESRRPATVDPDVWWSHPSQTGGRDRPPSRLADALPEGEAFERALDALLAPDDPTGTDAAH